MNYKEKIEQMLERIKSQVFLDPTLDIVFKYLFSVEATLIHFLNAILHLPDEVKIVSVRPQNKVTVKLTSSFGEEEVRFDLHAKLNNGKYLDLEMQRAGHSDFLDRIVLYASQLAVNSKICFDSERTTAEKREHPYLMPQTYSVWLCNFDVPFCKSYREELGLYRRSDLGNADATTVYDKKNYIIIDLTKFKPTNGTAEAEWLTLFKSSAKAKEAPETSDKTITDAYSRLRVDKTSENFLSEIAQDMVTNAEISTRLNDAVVAATAKERERSQKIIDEQARALSEQARKIAELEAQLAKLQK